jgi:hypothetical protein
MPSYEKTLGDARADLSLKQISGVRSSSDQFVALLNEVQQSLAARGEWFDLVQRITFKIRGTHLVWPAFVGTVLAVRFCGGLATMSNQWFSFLNNAGAGAWQWDYGYGGSYGVNGFGNGFGSGYGSGSGWLGNGSGTGKNGVVIEDDGTRPIYQEIANQTGMLIRYVVVNQQDYGKKITLFGSQYGGQPLQEPDPVTGLTVNGLTLTSIKPYAQTVPFVTDISSITREPTVGPAYLYGYDPALDIQLDLGCYQPNETNPRWRASRIVNAPRRINASNTPQTCASNECLFNIEALVKCKLMPVVAERDFLPISNFRAIKLGIQAVILEQSNNDVEANVKWLEAVAELNREQGDKQPARNAPIRIGLGRKCFSPI